MIKHGSGMAFCLKYVTNKVPSVAPLVLRQSHVPLCSRQFSKYSTPSPRLQETTGGSDISSAPLLDHQILIDSLIDQGKVLSINKCDSDVIRYISCLIYEHNDKSPTFQRQCKFPCQCSVNFFGVPYNGTPDDLKLSDSCDPKISYHSSEKKKHEDSIISNSNTEPSKLASEISQTDSTEIRTHTNKNPEDALNPPSETQLENIVQVLSTDLPNFFIKSLDYKIYHPNIVLEDNIRGKRFIGINQYNMQAKLLYTVGHVRFLFIKLDVLKITSHPEDGTVKVRWRMSVFRLSRVFQLSLSDLPASARAGQETWIDGFSTYYVKGDGLVHKHVADKMVPDPHQMLKKSESTKTTVVPQPLAYADRSKV